MDTFSSQSMDKSQVLLVRQRIAIVTQLFQPEGTSIPYCGQVLVRVAELADALA
jgi:hypothetical protein